MAPVVDVRADPLAPDTESEAEVTRRSAFVSVVLVPEGPAAGTSLADLVEDATGVRVRRAGGPGSAAAVSVRGSTPGQVQLFLDGIPLNRAAFDVVDLADLPVGAIERIEIHRGTAPPELGGYAVGGAVNLVTRAPKGKTRTSLGAGAGSFLTRTAELTREARARSLVSRVALHYAGTEGDFPYYDDGGTPLSPANRSIVDRTNAASESVDGLVRLRTAGDGLQGSVMLFAGAREQGVPGPTYVADGRAHSSRLRVFADVGVQVPRTPWPRADLSVRAHGSWRRERLSDPDAELGRGALDTDDTTMVAGARGVLRAGVGETHALTASLDASHERFVRGELGAADASAETRWSVAAAVADDVYLLADRMVLSGALRVDAVFDRFAGSTPGSATLDRTQKSPEAVLFSPRLGARFEVATGLHLKANAGVFHRVPAFYELFGRHDRLSPNPDLAPESALNGDFGVRFERPSTVGTHRVRLEAAFFASRVEDAVVFLQNSTRTIVARNLAGARIYGLEVDGAVSLPGNLRLTASWTGLHARQESPAPSEQGKPLPGRPEHDLAVGARWKYGSLDLAYRLSWLSGAYFDTAGFEPQPTAPRHDVTVQWRPTASIRVRIDVDNVLDTRTADIPIVPGGQELRRAAISDYADWPVPGRAAFVSLQLLDG